MAERRVVTTERRNMDVIACELFNGHHLSKYWKLCVDVRNVENVSDERTGFENNV